MRRDQLCIVRNLRCMRRNQLCILHRAEPPLHASEPALHRAEPLMHETGYPQRKRAVDEAKFRPRIADRTELFFNACIAIGAKRLQRTDRSCDRLK